MISSSDIIVSIAPYFKPYIELTKLSEEAYYFRKSSTSLFDEEGIRRIWHPKIEHKMLRTLHNSSEGILYIALPKPANPCFLNAKDLLYVGCSAKGGARFWRGKVNATTRFSIPKSCFHHEQMRKGRNGTNLETHLRENGAVWLYTLTNEETEVISRNQGISLPDGKYIAHKLEKRILMDGFLKWAWNKRR
ncbi:hypothetical protein EV681_3143 [Advenella incenata]|uniref:GIY-YIG domain-containing protein n=1 Tax=Advenella incenata TaxID=267800 RepID=A0A4V2FSL6_9BURK|nr:hypothetical protein [Advenella incenata]RZT94719.1 hypothetical protein EV681_3143 [Advenella incenata]